MGKMITEHVIGYYYQRPLLRWLLHRSMILQHQHAMKIKMVINILLVCSYFCILAVIFKLVLLHCVYSLIAAVIRVRTRTKNDAKNVWIVHYVWSPSFI